MQQKNLKGCDHQNLKPGWYKICYVGKTDILELGERALLNDSYIKTSYKVLSVLDSYKYTVYEVYDDDIVIPFTAKDKLELL